MSKRRVLVGYPFCIALIALVHAQEGVLRLHVADINGRPVQGVTLSPLAGGSASPPTTQLGKTELRLPPDVKPGSYVALQLARVSAQRPDWVFISPWDGRVSVYRSDAPADAVSRIIVARRGDREALESGKGLKAITAGILAEINKARSPTQPITEEQRAQILEEQADKYGLSSEEIDRAIREWSRRAIDPYEIGLSALYQRNYPKATEQLAESLKMREQRLEEAQAEVADAAYFLGQSLYEQGRYHEAAQSYQKAANIRRDDFDVLNALGIALLGAADYRASERYLVQARELAEKALGPNHTHVATSLNNLAGLYLAQGRYAEAEPLYQRSLTIVETALGPDHPNTQIVRQNYSDFRDQAQRKTAVEIIP